ncbi:MAG: M15 family metallopeptidase [bacterium]|nr:M15 family metallopeptidase [bacterium]
MRYLKEPLEEITEITAKMQYSLRNYPGSVKRPYLRSEAKNRLLKANEYAQKTYNSSILIWDAYRTSLCQGFLFYNFYSTLKKDISNGAQLVQNTLKFVAWPDDYAPHKSGGTIDMTLIDINGTPLPMGGEYDELTERSFTAYYERDNLSSAEIIYRDNRRKIQDVMLKVGFINYEEEWWHFEYKTRRYAKMHNETEIYGPINATPKP